MGKGKKIRDTFYRRKLIDWIACNLNNGLIDEKNSDIVSALSLLNNESLGVTACRVAGYNRREICQKYGFSASRVTRILQGCSKVVKKYLKIK